MAALTNGGQRVSDWPAPVIGRIYGANCIGYLFAVDIELLLKAFIPPFISEVASPNGMAFMMVITLIFPVSLRRSAATNEVSS